MNVIAKCDKCQKDIEVKATKSMIKAVKCADETCKSETKIKIVMLSEYIKKRHEHKHD